MFTASDAVVARGRNKKGVRTPWYEWVAFSLLDESEGETLNLHQPKSEDWRETATIEKLA